MVSQPLVIVLFSITRVNQLTRVIIVRLLIHLFVDSSFVRSFVRCLLVRLP